MKKAGILFNSVINSFLGRKETSKKVKTVIFKIVMRPTILYSTICYEKKIKRKQIKNQV